MASSFYKTQNNRYSPNWGYDPNKALAKEQVSTSKTIKAPVYKKPIDIKKASVPTFATIGQNMLQYRRNLLGLKNRLVARKFSKKDNENLDEFSRLRRKYDRNAIAARKFPVKPGQFKYPQRGLDKKVNPLYMTNYMDYGRLLPTEFEIPDKYHPINNTFTNQFSGGMYVYQGLNTAYTYSNVHNKQDGDM